MLEKEKEKAIDAAVPAPEFGSPIATDFF